MAPLPSVPNAPTRISSISNQNRLVVSWTPPSALNAPGGSVIGYKLEMDDGLGSNFTTIIDTVNAPTLTQVVVTSYSNQS